jgi:hypothetical protein
MAFGPLGRLYGQPRHTTGLGPPEPTTLMILIEGSAPFRLFNEGFQEAGAAGSKRP